MLVLFLHYFSALKIAIAAVLQLNMKGAASGDCAFLELKTAAIVLYMFVEVILLYCSPAVAASVKLDRERMPMPKLARIMPSSVAARFTSYAG